MPIINRIAEFHDDMTAWRRDIHAHPETAFEERRTAAVVAEKLKSFGIAIETGMAKTGVVGTLKAGNGKRAIALRADMDALHMQELNGFQHCSTHQGKMHACGHDGHTTMLLGAAKYLAETKNFDGTVHFIFQPAEENEGGARVMVEEGLFKKFPVESVFGMHNWPGLPPGQVSVRSGPTMAAFDIFEITIQGKGTHGAMPHLGIDPVPVAAEIILALQTIASRTTDPLEAVVVSVTQMHGGDTWNVVPDSVVLRGTCRAFKPAIHDGIEPAMKRIVGGICQAHQCTATVRYEKRYPPTVNTAAETELCARVAGTVFGEPNVVRDHPPSMGSEDFAWMLKEKPGCYIWIGNGGAEGGCLLHNPHYDFNDEILPIGASYWAKLVETTLPR